MEVHGGLQTSTGCKHHWRTTGAPISMQLVFAEDNIIARTEGSLPENPRGTRTSRRIEKARRANQHPSAAPRSWSAGRCAESRRRRDTVDCTGVNELRTVDRGGTTAQAGETRFRRLPSQTPAVFAPAARSVQPLVVAWSRSRSSGSTLAADLYALPVRAAPPAGPGALRGRTIKPVAATARRIWDLEAGGSNAFGAGGAPRI